MMNVGQIYSLLLKRAQSSSDSLDVWRIHKLIQDARKSCERLSEEPKVFRSIFRDDSYIDYELFWHEDGVASIRETEAFYPNPFRR